MIATAEYTISKIYDGQPGQPGSPGASVSNITRYYTISTSPTQLINPSWVDPNEPEWTTTQPSTDAIDENHYLWQKDITTLSNGGTIESNAWCERIISGIISQVNYDAGIISDKVWEEYTNTQIDAYDGSTTTTLGRKVSSMEQTVNGYDITVSGQTTHVDGLTERMTSAEGRLSVNENAITAMVTLDDQSSSLILTNNMIEAMTNQFIIKGSDNTTTVISGGKIVANTIKTNDLATDAIKSSNYVAPTGVIGGNGTAPFSVSGSFFDLTDGKILTPYFALIPDPTDGNGTPVTGTAYLKGTIETGSGHIGGFTITKTSIYNNMKSFDDEIDLSNYSLDDNFYLEVPSYYMTEDGEIIDSFELDEDNYIVGVTPIFYGVYIGTDGIALGRGKFKVDSFGNLFANSATITGNITATSGRFGIGGDYYDISTNGLIGYTSEYYYRMLKLSNNFDYIEINGITVKTSSNEIVTTYSYSDIQAMNHFVSIGFTYDENNNTYATLYVDEDIPLSSLFEGTITQVNCNYTYDNNGETTSGSQGLVNPTISGGVTTPMVNNIRTGTEVGYNYIKTGNLIANGGTVGGWNISDDRIASYTANGVATSYNNADTAINFVNGTNVNQDVLTVVKDIHGTAKYPVILRANGYFRLYDDDTTQSLVFDPSATNPLTIKGNIDATGGSIGGWNINAQSLSRNVNGTDIELNTTGLVTTTASSSDEYRSIFGSGRVQLQNSNGITEIYPANYTMQGNNGGVELYEGLMSLVRDNSDSYVSVHSATNTKYAYFRAISGSGTITLMSQPASGGYAGLLHDGLYWILSSHYTNHVTTVHGGEVDLESVTAGVRVRLLANQNGTPVFVPNTNGTIYLGTTSLRWKSVYCTDGAFNGSDLKGKSVVDDFDWKVDEFISGLKPIAFKRINEDGSVSERIRLGFGAQDVAKLSKDLDIGDLRLYDAVIVEEDENGEKYEKPYHGEDIDDSKLSWSLAYTELIAPMVLEIQRLMKRIDELERKINGIESNCK